VVEHSVVEVLTIQMSVPAVALISNIPFSMVRMETSMYHHQGKK
jgi:hypothetical protein